MTEGDHRSELGPVDPADHEHVHPADHEHVDAPDLEPDHEHVDEPDVEQPDAPGGDVVGLGESGDPRIAEAVDRLRQLHGTAPEEHIEVYEALHQVLQERLEDAQQADGGDPGPGGPRP